MPGNGVQEGAFAQLHARDFPLPLRSIFPRAAPFPRILRTRISILPYDLSWSHAMSCAQQIPVFPSHTLSSQLPQPRISSSTTTNPPPRSHPLPLPHRPSLGLVHHSIFFDAELFCYDTPPRIYVTSLPSSPPTPILPFKLFPPPPPLHVGPRVFPPRARLQGWPGRCDESNGLDRLQQR